MYLIHPQSGHCGELESAREPDDQNPGLLVLSAPFIDIPHMAVQLLSVLPGAQLT